MKKGQYLLMHSMIYRTKLLHDCGMELPKHTFYVDNLFAFEPLPYVKNLYYLDVNFYRYFIGRDDQSVNEKVMIKRIDQQIRVNKLMVDAYLKANVSNRRLRAYMFSYLDIITTVSSIMLVRAATQECLDKKTGAAGLHQGPEYGTVPEASEKSLRKSVQSSRKRWKKDVCGSI